MLVCKYLVENHARLLSFTLSSTVALETMKNLFTDEEIRQIVVKFIGSSNFSINNWQIEPISDVIGFLSDYFSLEIICDVSILHEDQT